MNTHKPCALCLKPAELRNSHIIPEFLYESMYDDKHRFHVIDVNERYSELEQKGYREPLLCQACETRLSVWEGYARSLFAGKIPLQFDRTGDRGVTWISGIDYTQFKLFQLSILWRTGVAQHRFFEQVSLGPHAEPLRRMLLASDPGEPIRYPCMMREVTLQGMKAQVIIQPTPTRIFSLSGFRFVFGGFFWAYAVASHAPPKGLHGAFLQRNGTMAMAPPGDLESANFMLDFMARHQQTIRSAP